MREKTPAKASGRLVRKTLVLLSVILSAVVGSYLVSQQNEIYRLNEEIRSLKETEQPANRRLLVHPGADSPLSSAGKNESCSHDEGEDEKDVVREIRITLYSAILILSGIVAVSVCFEKTEEVAEEKTKDHFKDLMRNVFSELTVLGFIGLLMFVVTKFGKEWLNELAGNPETGLFQNDCFKHCGKLICPENPFIELTETVHMILFGTMMIFLAETGLFYYFGTRILNKVSKWEQYTMAHTVDDSKQLVVKAAAARDKAYGKNVFDFVCCCKCLKWRGLNKIYTFQLQRFAYMAIRKNFIAYSNSKLTEKTKQHRLTAHFDFSLYLQYGLGEQIAAMVEISSGNWFALFTILSFVFLVDVIIVDSKHREVYTAGFVVVLGYLSAFLTYLVKMKLKSIERAVMPCKDGVFYESYRRGGSDAPRYDTSMRRPLLRKKLSRRLSTRLSDDDFLSEMKLDGDGNPVLAHLNAHDFKYEPYYKIKSNGEFDETIKYESNFKVSCCNFYFSKERIIDYLRVTQVLHSLYIGIFFIQIMPSMVSYWERTNQNHSSGSGDNANDQDLSNVWYVVSFGVLYIIPLVYQAYLLETILLHVIYVGNVETLTVSKNVAQCLRVMKSRRALQVLHNISCFMSYMDDVGKECQKTFLKIPLLQNLDKEHVQSIMLSCEPAVFRKGVDIITQDEESSKGLYIICSGGCDVFIHGIKVNTIAIGEYFGEVTLVSGGGATATVTANQLCICMLLDRETLSRLCPNLFREFQERKKTLKKTDTQIVLREMEYHGCENVDSMRNLLTLKRVQFGNDFQLHRVESSDSKVDVTDNIQDNSGKLPANLGRRRSTFGWFKDIDGERYLKGSVMEIKKRKSIDSAIQFHRRVALLDTFNLINEHGEEIDEEELISFLINLFPSESSMSAFYRLQVTLMIKTIDLDGDNTIDKYEWFNLMVPILEKEETESLAEEVFKKVFNILDYDNGGDITVSEFRDVLTKIGLNISYEEVREIINEHDDSGDGLMDLEEFVHMMKNQIH